MSGEVEEEDAPPPHEGEHKKHIGIRQRLAPLMRALLIIFGVWLVVIGNTAVPPAMLIMGGVFVVVASLYFWPVSQGENRIKALPIRGARLKAETRLVLVLDALAFPIVLMDRRGNVVHANAAADSTFSGLRTGYPVSFSIRAPELVAAIERILSGEAMAETVLVERIPVERSFAVTLHRLAQGASGAAYALISMRETTQERRIESMRVDFVANASHELRTPLASILGFVETLQTSAKNDEPARMHFLAIMATQARRMARLIDDLLSLSKIEMNAHVPPSGVVDLAGSVAQVVDALSGIARERDVQLRFTPPKEFLPVIGDRDEILRMIENLIENAIKYGQSGRYVDMSITPTELEGGVTLAVQDYGPGIAAEHLPRLTERFYRADVHESRVLGGTGLGLALVKHILSRHRGRMTIESALGKGATFRITLPAADMRVLEP